jgi:hypothetical protein
MKNITFRPTSELVDDVVEKPKPAKSYFPKWYKDTPKFERGKLEIDFNGQANVTMKSCMPFFDTFTTGYIQETWCDIYVKDTGDGCEWRYSSLPEIIEQRTSVHPYPKVQGFSETEFSWRQPWIPQLPLGYSMIYTHPFNRFDLPFLSLSGIIDNDRYYMERIANHPFYVREGFEGIIPKGTPMFQMIPIKRESWHSKFDSYDSKLIHKFADVKKYFYDGYKKMYWQKKEYR